MALTDAEPAPHSSDVATFPPSTTATTSSLFSAPTETYSGISPDTSPDGADPAVWNQLESDTATCSAEVLSDQIPIPVSAWAPIDRCHAIIVSKGSVLLISSKGQQVLAADLGLRDILGGVAATVDTVWVDTGAYPSPAVLVIDRAGVQHVRLPPDVNSVDSINLFQGSALVSYTDATGSAGGFLTIDADGGVHPVATVSRYWPPRTAVAGEVIFTVGVSSAGNILAVRDAAGHWREHLVSGRTNVTGVAASSKILVASFDIIDDTGVPVGAFFELSRDRGDSWSLIDVPSQFVIEDIAAIGSRLVISAYSESGGAQLFTSKDMKRWSPVGGDLDLSSDSTLR